MSLPKFGKPSEIADTVKPAEVDGHLLVVRPRTFHPSVTTRYGEGVAIDVDVLDVDTGEAFYGCRWFSKVLAATMRDHIGELLLGAMGRGIARGGQSAPWVLTDQTGNAIAVSRAAKAMEALPDFADADFADADAGAGDDGADWPTPTAS